MECVFCQAATLSPNVVEHICNEPGNWEVLFFKEITLVESDKLLGGEHRYEGLSTMWEPVRDFIILAASSEIMTRFIYFFLVTFVAVRTICAV